MAESDLYIPIRQFIENKLSFCGFQDVYIEITAEKKLSTKILTIFSHAFEVLEKRFYPDLVAIYKENNKLKSIAVEVKDDPLKMQDIFQALGYGKILKSEITFLITPFPIPDSIREFLVRRNDMLKSGKTLLYIGIIQNNTISDGSWFPKNPF